MLTTVAPLDYKKGPLNSRSFIADSSVAMVTSEPSTGVLD